MGATMSSTGAATVSGGRDFMAGGNGRWAGERFIKALKENRPISPKELRTLEILRNEEWKIFDNELIIGAQERLRGVADLLAAGLVTRITNGLAKTVLEYDMMGDMNDAITSMDGVTRDENDRLEFEGGGLPLPITHKDWYLNLRMLMASRSEGSNLGAGLAIDTTYIRVAGRKIGEATENMLFNGGKTFKGLKIYGYTTHPYRNTATFGTGGNWGQTAKTGDQVLTDFFTMVRGLEGDGHYGPYWMYVGGTDASLKLQEDFKAASDKTIEERLIETKRVSKIQVVDKLAAGNIVLVQPSADVVKMIEGEKLQTVQWDVHGGFQINFKGFQILVPLIRSDIDNKSGIFHMA